MKISRLTIITILTLCVAIISGCAQDSSVDDYEESQSSKGELERVGTVNGFDYYQREGVIYRSQAETPDKAKIILKLKISDYPEEISYAKFELGSFGDITALKQRVGSGTRGQSYTTLLFPDGKMQEFDFDVATYISGDKYDVVLGYNASYYGAVGMKGFFEFRETGKNAFRQFGNEDYWYGIFRQEHKDRSISMGYASELALYGDNAYLIATPVSTENPGIYRANLRTGKFERMTEGNVTNFSVKDGTIICKEIDGENIELKID